MKKHSCLSRLGIKCHLWIHTEFYIFRTLCTVQIIIFPSNTIKKASMSYITFILKHGCSDREVND